MTAVPAIAHPHLLRRVLRAGGSWLPVLLAMLVAVGLAAIVRDGQAANPQPANPGTAQVADASAALLQAAAMLPARDGQPQPASTDRHSPAKRPRPALAVVAGRPNADHCRRNPATVMCIATSRDAGQLPLQLPPLACAHAARLNLQSMPALLLPPGHAPPHA